MNLGDINLGPKLMHFFLLVSDCTQMLVMILVTLRNSDDSRPIFHSSLSLWKNVRMAGVRKVIIKLIDDEPDIVEVLLRKKRLMMKTLRLVLTDRAPGKT